ncbi:MAG: hypothetical protein J6I80_02820 [Clostridia bacterium]|nr:hypothetical protein [Clostridia bacterium]
MNKKFFSIALCFVLCTLLAVCSLSGCGKKKDKNGPTPSATQGSSSVVDQTGSDLNGTEGDEVIVGTSSTTGNKKPSSSSSKITGSSNKTNTTTGSSSKNEQSGIIPEDWELGDEEASSSSKTASTKPTSSTAVNSSGQLATSGNGGDIYVGGFPPGFSK